MLPTDKASMRRSQTVLRVSSSEHASELPSKPSFRLGLAFPLGGRWPRLSQVRDGFADQVVGRHFLAEAAPGLQAIRRGRIALHDFARIAKDIFERMLTVVRPGCMNELVHENENVCTSRPASRDFLFVISMRGFAGTNT